MRMRRIVLAALALGLSAKARAQEIAPPALADVPHGHWAYAAVGRLLAAGIIEGLPSDRFEGARAMTRYEFAVAMARLLDDLPAARNAQAAFTDVPAGHWSRSALGVASTLGLAQGLPSGRLAGDAAMTREAAAVAVARVLRHLSEEYNPAQPDKTGTVETAPEPLLYDGAMFSDVPSKNPSWPEVQRATRAGVFEGLPDGRFHGREPLTRYAFAVLVARLIDRAAGVCKIPGPP